ncbi:putative nuclease HARBI1 [Saccostrea echinata]|uniref:putative nuclease HARBI1 n=3 Tax=Saccostrea echinata TaxID=191078 RepID=UPI002A7F215F|nr:putative nuclease HARBI1 [Saccostrea echinata]
MNGMNRNRREIFNMAANGRKTCLLFVLFQDSDTDSDSEDENILLPALAGAIKKEKPKIYGYVEDVVPLYSDASFRRMFRLSRQTFQILSSYLEEVPEMKKDGNGGKERMFPQKDILTTLWYLGTLDSIDRIADRFGISPSSVIRARDRVMNSILTHLKSKFIKWPNPNELNQIANNFQQKNGFPGIAGALDGTHIRIAKPTNHGDSYINRKGFPSLQLQAVCKEDMMFTHVFTGFPGSCHDARVLRNSDLWENGLQMIPNIYHIIADAAYPLRIWLLTPYRDNGHLTHEQRRYNNYLSSNRMVIERAFALLKGRFRRLRFLETQKIEYAVKIIMTSCVLHNVCIFNHDEVDDFIQQDVIAANYNVPGIQDCEAQGVQKRNQIARNLL